MIPGAVKDSEDMFCPSYPDFPKVVEMCFSSAQTITTDNNLEIWGVIGTWVAGLGTVAAVILALSLALLQEKIKLIVHSSICMLIPSNGDKYLKINISNAGKRAVKITGTGWLIKHPFSLENIFRKRKVLGMTHTWDAPSSTLPTMLIEGDDVTLLKSISDDWIEDISENLMKLNAQPKHLKFCVYTSYGKSVTQKASSDFVHVLENSIADKQSEVKVTQGAT